MVYDAEGIAEVIAGEGGHGFGIAPIANNTAPIIAGFSAAERLALPAFARAIAGFAVFRINTDTNRAFSIAHRANVRCTLCSAAHTFFAWLDVARQAVNI